MESQSSTIQNTQIADEETQPDNNNVKNSSLNDSSENQNNQSQKSDDQPKYQPDDDITLVRVRFPGNAKSFAFLQGSRGYSYGEKVVAMSDRGMDVGYINSFPYIVKFTKDLLPLKSIAKVATQEDIDQKMENASREKEAEVVCVKLIRKLKLDMNITHVEIIQFGKKMVFYFTAPSRVDFRELVKQLVGDLKMRIELRQISVRDRAAALGSIGACGLATCCSTFLKNYGNVSIKMAKNQNLALIPSKINGVCGQLKCCIKYEDEVYTQKRTYLPREGSFIKVKNGDIGKVTRLHILAENFDMITDQGQIRRYIGTQWDKSLKLPKDWKFPTRFDHVVNETSTVIGTNEQIIESQKLTDEQKATQNLKALDEGGQFFDNIKEKSNHNDEKDSENNPGPKNDVKDKSEQKVSRQKVNTSKENETDNKSQNKRKRTRKNRKPNHKKSEQGPKKPTVE